METIIFRFHFKLGECKVQDSCIFLVPETFGDLYFDQFFGTDQGYQDSPSIIYISVYITCDMCVWYWFVVVLGRAPLT